MNDSEEFPPLESDISRYDNQDGRQKEALMEASQNPHPDKQDPAVSFEGNQDSTNIYLYDQPSIVANEGQIVQEDRTNAAALNEEDIGATVNRLGDLEDNYTDAEISGVSIKPVEASRYSTDGSKDESGIPRPHEASTCLLYTSRCV